LSLRYLFAIATLGFVAASIACALSTSFNALIAARVVQGFFGGMLIPAVFTAVFVLIPKPSHVLATTMAGVAALLAPTLGPLVGGWLTQTQSWHWIFLVNIFPGLLVALVVILTLARDETELSVLKRLDILTLLLFAIFLAGLQWLLHEAPGHHWRGGFVFGLAALCVLACGWGIHRALSVTHPFVHLGRFRNRGNPLFRRTIRRPDLSIFSVVKKSEPTVARSDPHIT